MHSDSKNILILVDDRGQFFSSIKEPSGSMNINLILKLFKELGYFAVVKGFSEIQFSNKEYKDHFILYQSTEDPDLRYKDYIEDILLGLEISGANLIPCFEYFRAHHNKVFMEILREKIGYGEVIKHFHFGTLEELAQSKFEFVYPMVVKPGAGSKSIGVSLAHNKKQLIKMASKISRSFTLLNSIRRIKSFFKFKTYRPISNHRKKFIIQEFIQGLSGDYKILIYWDKYYIVKRKNRHKDFRASGSGLLSFPENIPNQLLDYAKYIFEKSNAPFMGIDLADLNGKYYLIEFQFVTMGNYALEKSNFHFEKISDKWQLVHENSSLESMFVKSVDQYIINCKKNK